MILTFEHNFKVNLFFYVIRLGSISRRFANSVVKQETGAEEWFYRSHLVSVYCTWSYSQSNLKNNWILAWILAFRLTIVYVIFTNFLTGRLFLYHNEVVKELLTLNTVEPCPGDIYPQGDTRSWSTHADTTFLPLPPPLPSNMQFLQVVLRVSTVLRFDCICNIWFNVYFLSRGFM